MLDDVLNLDGRVKSQFGKLIVHRINDATGVSGAVQEIRVTKGNVLGARRHLLTNVVQHDINRHSAEASIVNRYYRAVTAQMLAATCRLGEPDYAGVSKGARAIYYRGGALSPLPATRKEVERVGTTRLLGAQASEGGLGEALPLSKRWRAVHFACHGLVDADRPMLSSLALSRAGDGDGFLTALEILRTEIPADLAVLSACETGKGEIVQGEGIVGFTRAFMFAGTARVICSLWKVDDEATQALMIKFYELWNPQAKPGDPERPKGVEGSRPKGLGAAEALQKAQQYVRDFRDENGKQKWKHPYYWGAWVLWGLPN